MPTDKDTILRVAYPNDRSISDFDPAELQVTRQVNIIRNLFQPLVEMDNAGMIKGCVAEKFYWKGNSLRFKVRRDLKTIDGISITAQDAYLSLKRTMIKKSNTHASLAQFLCPESAPKTLDEPCTGLFVENDELVLVPESLLKRTFLLPILASADFSVIPVQSLDLKDPKIPIRDYRNTSGLYYLSKDDAEGAFEFAINPHHFHFSETVPTKIRFVPAYGKDAVRLFKDGSVDLLTTIDTFSPDDLQFGDEDSISLHETLDIKLWILSFLQPGISKFSPEERHSIGEQVRTAFMRSELAAGLKPTSEFFPVFGDGSLNDELKTRLKQVVTTDSGFSSKKVKLASPAARAEKYREIFKELNFIEIQIVSRPPWTLPPEEMPDIYIADTDSGFFEDISLISYNINTGAFGLSKEDGQKWLDRYMAVPEKKDRVALLRDLHFEFLFQGKLVPLAHGPYRAAARAPWKLNLSKFYAGTRLWQISNH